MDENVSVIGSLHRDYSRSSSKFTGENYPYRLRLTGRPDRRGPLGDKAAQEQVKISI